MITYQYKAMNPAGEIVKGSLESPSEVAVVQQLQAKGLIVLNVARGKAVGQFAHVRKAFGPAHLVSFTQQLATLLGAGQPLERALATLVRQEKDGKRRDLVMRVREQVKAGKALSQALHEENGQFSAFYISLIRAGEAGGQLETALVQLSVFLERNHKLRGEVINSLIYPAFLIVGVIGSLALLLAYVVPQFVPIFNDLGVPIPWITQVILTAGDWMNAYGLLAIGVVISLLLTVIAMRRSPQRREAQDRRLMQLKVIGALLQCLEAARLGRTLGTLLSNGVSLLQALLIVRDISSNFAIRALLIHASDHVKSGGTLSNALSHQSLLPELALQMVEVGEQSGQLHVLLIKAAEIFDQEAKRDIDRMLAALVPTLTVVMAGMVALIMLAIMLPLTSLTSNI